MSTVHVLCRQSIHMLLMRYLHSTYCRGANWIHIIAASLMQNPGFSVSVLQSSSAHVQELWLPDKMEFLSYSPTNKTVPEVKHEAGKDYVHMKILINSLFEDERQNLFSDFLFVFYWYSNATWDLWVVWVPILLYANKRSVSLIRKGYSFKRCNFLCHVVYVDFICSYKLL